MLDEDVPIFNLRAVVRETGVKPDTLRAWERRYGLPNPKRTDGGHRIYSRRDIDTVKWLAEKQEAGLGISKAVELWKQLDLDGQNGSVAVDRADVLDPLTSQERDVLSDKREAWIAACMDFDEQHATRILSEAFALFSVERVCLDVLMQGVANIGQRWFEGNTTVQQEHFATSLATRQLDSLLAAASAPTRHGRILATCPPQETHVFSLLLLTVLLRRAGWDVVYLGANAPIDHISDTIARGHFQLVVSSAQLLHTAASLKRLANAIQPLGIPLVYGGRIFNLLPELRSRIPGTFLGETLDGAPKLIERLMVAQPSTMPMAELPQELSETLVHYRRQLPAIDAAMEKALQGNGITLEQLSQANRSMGSDISAALSFGNLDYLGEEVAWVEGLLQNQGFPAELLDRYLITYHEVLQEHLDERGEPIVDWLSKAL